MSEEDDDRPRRRMSDSDFDARPGGARESRSYDRRYNPQGEDEYTNLPENANQLEIEFAERELAEREAELERMRAETEGEHVKYWPKVGKFIIPTDNTFAAHQELARGELAFDPERYPEFDGIIARIAPQVLNPENAQMRENLAVLRNDIMGIYMNDASFDPGDERFLPLLRGVATELGEGIRSDGSWWRRSIYPRLDAQLLNMEGDGAAYAYSFLLKHQQNDGVFASLMHDIRALLRLPMKEWELPPIEQTAFSEAALDAPPPRPQIALSEPSRGRGFTQERARGNAHWQDLVEQQRAQAALEAGHGQLA